MIKEKSEENLELKQYVGAFTRWMALGGLVLHSVPYCLNHYFGQSIPAPNPDTTTQMSYILNLAIMMSYPVIYMIGAKIEGNAIIQKACNKSKELSDKI